MKQGRDEREGVRERGREGEEGVREGRREGEEGGRETFNNKPVDLIDRSSVRYIRHGQTRTCSIRSTFS